MYIFVSTHTRVVTCECMQAHACLHIMFVVFTLSRMQIVAFTHTRTCMPACIFYADPRVYLCGVIIFHHLVVHTLLHQALCSGVASCRSLSPPCMLVSIKHCVVSLSLQGFPPPLQSFLCQTLCVCKIFLVSVKNNFSNIVFLGVLFNTMGWQDQDLYRDLKTHKDRKCENCVVLMILRSMTATRTRSLLTRSCCQISSY